MVNDMDIIKVMEAVMEVLGAVSLLLSALYGLALLIPGDEPDNSIKKILEVTQRLSRK